MDSLHHELQRGINERASVFGVEAFDERRGAFEIGKQCSDGFTFTVGHASRFHRGLLSPDALGQMWRGVVDGSRVQSCLLLRPFPSSPFRPLFPCEWRATLVTELASRRVYPATLKAG